MVYAIAPRDDYSDKLTAAGVTYIDLPMQAHSTSPLEDMKMFFRLYQIYRAHRFDMILHYTIKMNIYGAIAAKANRLISISIITGLGRTFQFSNLIQKLINRLYRVSASCAQELWFLNTEDEQRFIDERIVKSEKTFVLPSEGVNLSRFIGSALKDKTSGVTRFLFAGRLLKDKGILEFVEAAKRIIQLEKKVKFEVVGFVNPNNSMSVTLSELEEWQKQGWINYLGSHEDIRPYINRADCIVFPSYYQEGVSRILLEACSMSRPVITTDQVGCRDVVEDNVNGLLTTPRSVDSTVRAIFDFLNLSHNERLAMGQKGRQKVKESFDENHIIDIYFEKLFGHPTNDNQNKGDIKHVTQQ